VSTEEILSLGATDYRPVWEALEQGDHKINYQSGEVLLTSAWHQSDPYNRECPGPDWFDDCTEPRCDVGCNALVGAQIMHYWCWPPYGDYTPYNDPYDWPNMPDSLTDSSTETEIYAIAELCYEVGLAVGMEWCEAWTSPCGSGVPWESMTDVYERLPFYYSNDCAIRHRRYYTEEEWFDLIKIDLNINRPIHYHVPGHNVVLDGWLLSGDPIARECHLNLGWKDSSHAWFSFDSFPYADTLKEGMLIGIYPRTSFHDVINGTYPRESTLPYRYFDRDVTGGPAIIENGQGLQFLPNISVTCTIDSVLIYGSPPDTLRSRLFTRGDQSRGVLISNGAVKMKPGGSIKFF
jgi:hypothetical protein